MGRIKLYGRDEIAQACYVSGPTVSNWIARGKVPAPDEYLSCGPIWLPETIEPFIESYVHHPSTAGVRNG